MLAEKNKRKKLSSAEAIAKGDMEALGASLSYRQRRWCEEFILDYNATAAARRAGYQTKYMDRQAYQLQNHEGCAAYVEHLDKIKRDELNKDVLDKDYVIAKIIKGLNKADDQSNLTAYLRACELLARHLGMFIERTELTGKDGEAIVLEQKAQREAEELITSLKRLSKKTDIKLL